MEARAFAAAASAGAAYDPSNARAGVGAFSASGGVYASRLSMMAYLPTADDSKEVVLYSDFMTLAAEVSIERRSGSLQDGTAAAALESFCGFFYSGSEPGHEKEGGHGRHIREIVADYGLSHVVGICIKETDTHGFVATTTNIEQTGGDVVIAWRGTVSAQNWATNLEGSHVLFDPTGSGGDAAVLVHDGFYANLMSAMDVLKQSVVPLLERLAAAGKPVRVVTTGHSLGGALAHLTVGWLLRVLGPEAGTKFGKPAPDVMPPTVRVLSVTFGAPKTGNDKFAAFIDRNPMRARDGRPVSSVNVFRVLKALDPIPNLPPPGLGSGEGGYRHCGERAIVSSQDGKLLLLSEQYDVSLEDKLVEVEACYTCVNDCCLCGVGGDFVDFHSPSDYSAAMYAFQVKAGGVAEVDISREASAACAEGFLESF